MIITPLERWIAGLISAPETGLSRGAIDACQLARLRETLDWARERSGFYREHLEGTQGLDLSSLDDLATLPFTAPADVRREPHRFLCVSQSRVARVVTLQTSGTSGSPKRVFFTAEDQERTIDFFHHGMSTFTGVGDRVLILMPGDLPGSVGDLLVKGLDRLGAVGVPHGPVLDPFRTLAVMDEKKIDALVGIPTQVLGLARCSGGKAAPRSVLLSADHVPVAVTQELYRIWGCRVYTHYGMTEMGFGGGVECEAQSGYHLREADLYIEIVDPQTGNPVPDGARGEIVFTTLTRKAMPLIRYRTGDVSRMAPGPCECGTVLKTLARVRTRLSSLRRLRTGGLLSMADLDEALFPIPEILDFSASLSCRDGGEDLVVAVRVGNPGRGEILRKAEEALSSISMVRDAMREGSLRVQVESAQEVGMVTRGAAKRTIVDMRD